MINIVDFTLTIKERETVGDPTVYLQIESLWGFIMPYKRE
jgi:hypothetical protein